jgi:hypothetical protein
VEIEGAEGWYSDPYGRHGARWMSDGTPTKLVRDGGFESYDDPPNEVPTHPAVKLGTEGRPGDLRRADDAEREPFDEAKANEVALEAWGQREGREWP